LTSTARFVSTYPIYAYNIYDKWKFEIPGLWHKGGPYMEKIKPTPIIKENDVWVALN